MVSKVFKRLIHTAVYLRASKRKNKTKGRQQTQQSLTPTKQNMTYKYKTKNLTPPINRG